MPNIPLLDGLGLDVSGDLRKGAKLPQVLAGFTNFRDVPLDRIPVQNAHAGLTFDGPVDVSIPNLSLKAGVTGGGTVCVLQSDQQVTDPNDPFENITIGRDDIYV